MVHLYNFTLPELKDWLAHEFGEKPYRAVQLFEWMYQKRATGFEEMTNLPKSLREALAERAFLRSAKEVVRQDSKVDPTSKFLLEWPDGVTVETVLMRHNYGNSVCVSSQVGCKMGCTFCASTLGS